VLSDKALEEIRKRSEDMDGQAWHVSQLRLGARVVPDRYVVEGRDFDRDSPLGPDARRKLYEFLISCRADMANLLDYIDRMHGLLHDAQQDGAYSQGVRDGMAQAAGLIGMLLDRKLRKAKPSQILYDSEEAQMIKALTAARDAVRRECLKEPDVTHPEVLRQQVRQLQEELDRARRGTRSGEDSD